MARITYVKSAKGRKDGRPRRCSGCGKEIQPGDSYKWFANRIGRYSQRKDFCDTCRIRPSMQTTSPHLSALYAAQENAEDALSAGGDELTLGDIAQIVREYGEAVREVGTGYEESADNIEDGFGHETQQSEEIREKASACEEAADAADSAADDIEGMDDPDEEASDIFSSEGDPSLETNDEGDPIENDEFEEWVEGKRQERREAAIDAANDAISEGPQF